MGVRVSPAPKAWLPRMVKAGFCKNPNREFESLPCFDNCLRTPAGRENGLKIRTGSVRIRREAGISQRRPTWQSPYVQTVDDVGVRISPLVGLWYRRPIGRVTYLRGMTGGSSNLPGTNFWRGIPTGRGLRFKNVLFWVRVPIPLNSDEYTESANWADCKSVALGHSGIDTHLIHFIKKSSRYYYTRN